MNLEVRVGETGQPNSENSGNTRLTDNKRCGMYYGPTLVPQQWVQVDCGFARGLKGSFITLQLTERFGGDHPLQVTSLEVYGWGRVCGSDDPDPYI